MILEDVQFCNRNGRRWDCLGLGWDWDCLGWGCLGLGSFGIGIVWDWDCNRNGRRWDCLGWDCRQVTEEGCLSPPPTRILTNFLQHQEYVGMQVLNCWSKTCTHILFCENTQQPMSSFVKFVHLFLCMQISIICFLPT